MLVDGKRMRSATTNYRPDLGRQDLNWISPDQIERIEVVRGPMSSLRLRRHGRDQHHHPAHRRRMERQRHHTTRPGDGKRGDTQQIGATFSGPLGERFGLRIGANSMRRDSDQSNHGVYGNAYAARRTALSMRCCSGS